MSDLISRKRVLSLIKQACNPYGKPTIDFEVGKRMMQVVEQMPSADIMECARALLDYSKGRKCEECCFESACNNGFSCPCDWVLWDLPEGEKGGE